MDTQASGGGRLLAGNDSRDVEVTPFLTGEAALYSARNPDRESPNEDAACLVPIDDVRGILIVADGAGGLPAGKEASRCAVEAMRDAVRGEPLDGSGLRHLILNGFEAANAAVQSLGLGAATTLVVGEIDGMNLRPYHVGDSMILVTGQRGRVKLETIPHSPTGYAVESGLMDAHEAIVHEERHLVSNLVGTKDMRIEVGAPLELAPRDTVLLATDGLSDNLLSDEIVGRIRKGRLARAARALADACHERVTGETAASDAHQGKPDDVTFIAFRPTRMEKR